MLSIAKHLADVSCKVPARDPSLRLWMTLTRETHEWVNIYIIAFKKQKVALAVANATLKMNFFLLEGGD